MTTTRGVHRDAGSIPDIWLFVYKALAKQRNFYAFAWRQRCFENAEHTE